METEDEVKLREELGLGNAASVAEGDIEEDEVMETVVVPVAPQDVRAGKKDIEDTTLPLPVLGHTVLQTPDVPQPGHYPPIAVPSVPKPAAPTAPAFTSIAPLAPTVENAETQDISGGMGDEEFVSFATLPEEETGARTSAREVKEGGMEVDDDGSDEGIPDLDSELSGFEDDDEDDEDE